MSTEKTKKNAGYLSILRALRDLRDAGLISVREFDQACEFYRKLTGADIVLAG